MAPDFWKRKLAACLHDPLQKLVGIGDNEADQSSFLNLFNLPTVLPQQCRLGSHFGENQEVLPALLIRLGGSDRDAF
jgi:hypothetical protein